jgi:hypothetical protein
MNSDKSSPITPAPPAGPRCFSLSPYFTEQFPDREDLLAAPARDTHLAVMIRRRIAVTNHGQAM